MKAEEVFSGFIEIGDYKIEYNCNNTYFASNILRLVNDFSFQVLLNPEDFEKKLKNGENFIQIECAIPFLMVYFDKSAKYIRIYNPEKKEIRLIV